MSIKVNLHAHTFRCGHAKGSEEEYIQRAMQNGIEIMGFSDHMPFLFPNGYQSGYRVKVEDAKDYIDCLQKLKKKYEGKIDIRIGFEMEYYTDHFKDMFNYAKKLNAEYLILGEHFPSYEDGRFEYAGVPTKNGEALRSYVDGCIAGINSGVFTYVAHPDVFNFVGDKELYSSEMKRLCIAAKNADIPLEINFLGIRSNRHYPNPLFWQIAGEVGCKAVYGFDAHSPLPAYDGQSEEAAKRIIDQNNLTLIEYPKIIDIQGVTL